MVSDVKKGADSFNWYRLTPLHADGYLCEVRHIVEALAPPVMGTQEERFSRFRIKWVGANQRRHGKEPLIELWHQWTSVAMSLSVEEERASACAMQEAFRFGCPVVRIVQD
ncbi:hypothetical protein EAH_00052500 [Eimeria acervulina]|uniref:Uncharacterized protein n=1 Tax=Eimeria acervulina TaxID=5801 RepID=U6GPK8_EIMAC|nr:hypothetical protein EAH_00052500 [Eimeria acervulina]CDI80529.1 hypothetical protein EAH_00052500 [Eimeria acervulina]